MNERILELAEQARDYADDTYKNFSNNSGWFELYNEKFADMIVRECFEHCKGQLVDKKTAEHMGLTYNDAVGDCANGLLEHFGVEE